MARRTPAVTRPVIDMDNSNKAADSSETAYSDFSLSEDVNTTWDRLRFHLETTAGYPSIVFLFFESLFDEKKLMERTGFLAGRLKLALLEISAESEASPKNFPKWAYDHIPDPRVIWLSLTETAEDEARAALYCLNELRGKLHLSESGCLIISMFASMPMSKLAMEETSDLWSVRSFAQYISLNSRNW